VSVGPAVLNDHAVNYRELVKSIPDKMILVESDATAGNANEQPSVVDIARKTAELRGMDFESFAGLMEKNAVRFLER
jgi:Tat protein secretion system quality control protein TatD with DNase activity